MQDKALAIGSISGTSVDGIDTALVEIIEAEGVLHVHLLAGHTFDYDRNLRDEILAVCAGAPLSVARLCQLDDAIATAFARAALSLVRECGVKPDLIASHGQTVYHQPPGGSRKAGETIPNYPLGYSVQLGRGAVIAQQTGITTVSDFRTADIEAGGHGAPLVPMVDWLLLTHKTKTRACQNIGGIGNVTYLPASGAQSAVFGWDNGPGNVLIDMATQKLFGKPFDPDGQLARRGRPYLPLVQTWLGQDFFNSPPPKSTGRELFSPEYLLQCLVECDRRNLSPHDVLATLTELTARAIVHSYDKFLPQFPDEVLVCGGGSRNAHLMQRLKNLLTPAKVTATDSAGVNADFKEAIAFAVLGYLRLRYRAGNLPQVTGAYRSEVLGKIHSYP